MSHVLTEAGPRHLRAIDALLWAAFGGAEEAQLMLALRAAGDVVREVVMEDAGQVVAHAALSRMVSPPGWLALAPVAVLPERQRQGIGQRMVTALVAEAVAQGQTVVVLGEPAFYARCGFSPARAARLASPYPLEYHALARPGADVPRAKLVYAPAFGGA